MFVIGHRQRIVAEADEFLSNAQDDEDEDDEDDDEKLRKRASRLNMPSEEAQKKFGDHSTHLSSFYLSYYCLRHSY